MSRRSRSKKARAARERVYSSIPEDEQARDAGYMEGQRAALEGMDLPDGAYLAMMDEMGLDPY